jgi:hypothetical protein
MSSASHRESRADDGLSVVVASRSVEMSGNDTDNESEEFSPIQYLKCCDAKKSDRQSDAGQDWIRYSYNPSSLTSSSRGDDEDINYQLKFTSRILITNSADISRNESFDPLVIANLHFFCFMIFLLEMMM